jgi:hypothetical protein
VLEYALNAPEAAARENCDFGNSARSGLVDYRRRDGVCHFG